MTGSGSFWRACCRFKGRCGPCRDHGRVRDGSSTGSTSASRRAGANTYSSRARRGPRSTGSRGAAPPGTPRARRGHCPWRGFACQIPVTEDQESARRRRGGEGGREYSFAPASCTKRTVVERAFASYKQWRGRTGRPPRTNSPSSAQRASSSTLSSPGVLKGRALAAVSFLCAARGRVFEMFPARCPPRSSCRAARMDWRRPVRAEWCAA